MSPLGSIDLAEITVAPAPTRFTLRSLVVATDGMDESDAALRIAGTLASRWAATIRAISVCEPIPPLLEFGSGVPVFLPSDPRAVEAVRRTLVTAQIERVLGPRTKCPFDLRTGIIEDNLYALTAESRADLLLTGRGRHHLLDRVLGEEHLARLLRTAPCSVFAVDPSLRNLPKRVVIGIDFSERSLQIARFAATVIDDDAAIYLVHVKPDPPFGIPHPGRWIKSYEDGVRAGLAEARARLALPASRTVETVVLNGHPGIMLSEFATQSGADAIVVGVHGAGFFDRLVIGSVTNYLLRSAPCSLLAIPSPLADRLPD